MKKTLLKTLAFLFSFSAFSQNTLPESSEKNILLLDNTLLKIRKLYTLAESINNTDIGRAKRIFHLSYHIAKENNHPEWIPKIEFNLGNVGANLSQPDSALYYYNRALYAFQKQNNLKWEAKIFGRICWVYNYLGNFDKALLYGFRALTIYQKLNDPIGIAKANSDLASVFFSQNNSEEAINYAQKAYDEQKQSNILRDLSTSAQILGDAWMLSGNFQKALAFLNESLKIRRLFNYDTDIALSLNSRANVYKKKRQYIAALADYKESLRIAQNSGIYWLTASVTGSIGHIYTMMGKYREALPYLIENEKLLKKTFRSQQAVDNYKLLAETYGQLNKYDSAFYFQKKASFIGDSLLNAQKNIQFSSLKTQYESEQKETQIALQNKQLSEDRIKLWTLSSFLGLMIIGGLMLFRLIRTLRQRNKEKEYLIREIHHRVKNNLQVLSSLLHLQSKYIKDKAALEAIRESENRVEAMGLIHQKLYMGINPGTVDMNDYLKNLGISLLDSFGLLTTEQVTINYKLDPIYLDVDTAMIIGLIVNELLTNSLKYAFPEGRTGEIELSFCEENGKLCLQVKDNGIGSAKAPELNNGTAFGLNLVKILSKKLKGDSKIIETTEGYSTFLQFEKVLGNRSTN
ncbi:tetratricopeptide repeat protein [Runella salmonicolor]|uniref:histidine kinase n=1 Tax=Runella salmonicolor TaxID=2950278 RepID=A0ABT1FWU4_9BACT|nr:tetratricopeptide repeat protein [Runella salmonicolor]MCP1386224.1 tetratricopeptide repeat protein [Runella salmonicolor]